MLDGWLALTDEIGQVTFLQRLQDCDVLGVGIPLTFAQGSDGKVGHQINVAIEGPVHLCVEKFEAGEAITFSGEAVDSSTPPEALVFQWFADGTELSGAVSANGQSIVVSSQLAAGIRTVELRVTDTDGDVGMASRYHLRHTGRSRDGVGSRGPGATPDRSRRLSSLVYLVAS